jgi:hypothetical protein
MENNLILNGWRKPNSEWDGKGDEDDSYEATGPILMGGDILASWEPPDMASDFLELIGILCGAKEKEIVGGIILAGRLLQAHVHATGRRQRQADIWITLNDEEGCFDGIYVKENVFVSPEVREMIEVAAIGKED